MEPTLDTTAHSRLGFHYAADSLHYREKDLQTWLPELQKMGAGWLTLQAPAERAVPEVFLSGLLQANIRPILQCQNGSVASVGVARGLQDRVRQMLRRIPEKPVALMLHYLLPAPTADALRQAIEQKFEGVPLYTAIGGPVLGIHLGAGTIGVSWITE